MIVPNEPTWLARASCTATPPRSLLPTDWSWWFTAWSSVPLGFQNRTVTIFPCFSSASTFSCMLGGVAVPAGAVGWADFGAGLWTAGWLGAAVLAAVWLEAVEELLGAAVPPAEAEGVS